MSKLRSIARRLEECASDTVPAGTVDVYPNGPYTTLVVNSSDVGDVVDILRNLPRSHLIKVFGNKIQFPYDPKGALNYLGDEVLEALRYEGFVVATAH